MNIDNIIEINHFDFFIDNKQILNDINLNIKKRRILKYHWSKWCWKNYFIKKYIRNLSEKIFKYLNQK